MPRTTEASATEDGTMALKERGAISGIGETAYNRNSGKSVVALQMEASLAAIADAGLTPTDIDGIIAYTPSGVVQQCGACRKIRHYPRPACDACYSMQVAWIEASGRGRVHSWTVAHHLFHPGFKGELSYIVAIVDLEEGVRMNAQMRGVTPGEMRIGLPVQVIFEPTKEGLTLPAFVRAT